LSKTSLILSLSQPHKAVSGIIDINDKLLGYFTNRTGNVCSYVFFRRVRAAVLITSLNEIAPAIANQSSVAFTSFIPPSQRPDLRM
jgi:hypothetical protein